MINHQAIAIRTKAAALRAEANSVQQGRVAASNWSGVTHKMRVMANLNREALRLERMANRMLGLNECDVALPF